MSTKEEDMSAEAIAMEALPIAEKISQFPAELVAAKLESVRGMPLDQFLDQEAQAMTDQNPGLRVLVPTGTDLEGIAPGRLMRGMGSALGHLILRSVVAEQGERLPRRTADQTLDYVAFAAANPGVANDRFRLAYSGHTAITCLMKGVQEGGLRSRDSQDGLRNLLALFARLANSDYPEFAIPSRTVPVRKQHRAERLLLARQTSGHSRRRIA